MSTAPGVLRLLKRVFASSATLVSTRTRPCTALGIVHSTALSSSALPRAGVCNTTSAIWHGPRLHQAGAPWALGRLGSGARARTRRASAWRMPIACRTHRYIARGLCFSCSATAYNNYNIVARGTGSLALTSCLYREARTSSRGDGTRGSQPRGHRGSTTRVSRRSGGAVLSSCSGTAHPRLCQ